MKKFFTFIIFSLSLAASLFGKEEPPGAYASFKEEVHLNNYPFESSNQTGILDGDRKPAKKVQYSSEMIASARRIEYVIVIFQENWSFDGLYGTFPGANGIEQAPIEQLLQTDLTGRPYSPLLTSVDTRTGHPYKKIPSTLPNAPFNLGPYFPMEGYAGSALHHFYQEQYQINGGKMDRFAAFSTAGGFVMSYYDTTDTEMAKIAREFVLCDNWFHSCYGGSTLGALWLFSAQMPRWPNPPEELTARLLPSGILIKDGLATKDGYAINDAEPFYAPNKKGLHGRRRMPAQTHKTIGDLLSAKNISWKWYAEGWSDAVNGKPDPSFPFHHQAPSYFAQFAPGTKARAEHLADLKEFYKDLESDKMPAVSFIRSLNINSEHPGSAPLLQGLNWCSTLIRKIQASPIWDKVLILVTYDENGGRWDHVSPPVEDRWGPGTRVPAIIVSPFAKRGYVDNTPYETVSILKFIEERFDLPPLSTRDEKANNILNALELSQTK